MTEEQKIKRNKAIEQRVMENRASGVQDISFVNPDVRKLADKIMEANSTLASVAFDLVQTNTDADVSAILIELDKREDDGRLKVRYIYG